MKKQKDQPVDRISSKALKSLKLPRAFSATAHKPALDLDALLAQDDISLPVLGEKMRAYQEAAHSHLIQFYGKQRIDAAPFRWPPYLYIPQDVDGRNYWIGPAPADHRYTQSWTVPATGTPNKAEKESGYMHSFSQLIIQNPGDYQFSESLLGVLYKPSMSLGVVDLQPKVFCLGEFGTRMGFAPLRASGYVETKAELVLGAWQVLPNGGLDLIGLKLFEVATSGQKTEQDGRYDQTMKSDFQKSYGGSDLSAPFLVQAGRTYLFAIGSQIEVITTLKFDSPHPNVSNATFRAWGWITCVVPEINIITERVYIP